MMKKWLLALCGVLFFAPVAFADNWGFGVKLGVAETDPKTLNDVLDASGGELTEGDAFFGLEALHEWNLNSDINKLGLKIGLDIYGETEFKAPWFIGKITENVYSFPLTVYYKQDYGVQNWSWFAGVGFTFMRGEMDDGEETYNKNIVFPHITAGAEYRFTEVFALGIDAKYNIDAEMEKRIDGVEYKTDRSGLSGAITARFYF